MRNAFSLWTIMLIGYNLLQAQSPAIDLSLTVSDGAGGNQQLRFGLDPAGTDGIDASLGESELPPVPPSGVFDARFIGDDIGLSLGQGILKDYRQGNATTNGVRIHEIKYQVGTGTSIVISWSLPSGVTGKLQDVILGTLIDQAMSGSGSYTVTNPGSFSKLKMTITYALSGGGTVPTVTTGSATSVTATGAQLRGTVNPNGASTTYYFEYGTTTSYGSQTSSASAGSGTSASSVSATLTGLTAGTTYHYRIVATNSAGTSRGSDGTFTTISSPGGEAIDLSLTVSDGSGGTQQLRFGLDPIATDGIDAALEEAELPPMPPSGVFDARFVGDDIGLNLGQGILKDYRQGSAATSGVRIYEIKYQVGTGSSIVISWNLPNGVTGRLQDVILGTLIDTAMSGSRSYTVTNPGSFSKLKMTITYAPSGNRKPSFVNKVASTTLVDGQTLSFTYTAIDPDNDPISFSLVSPPTGATITSGGIFTWTPSFAQAGRSHDIIVVASDNGGGVASAIQRDTARAIIIVNRSIRRGDANLNGHITASDAAVVLQYTVGLYSPPASDTAKFAFAADASANGRVTAYDAAKILLFVVDSLANPIPTATAVVSQPVSLELSKRSTSRIYWGESLRDEEKETTEVPFLISSNASDVYSLQVTIDVSPGLDVLRISMNLPKGWLTAYNVAKNDLRIAVAGFGPIRSAQWVSSRSDRNQPRFFSYQAEQF